MKNNRPPSQFWKANFLAYPVGMTVICLAAAILALMGKSALGQLVLGLGIVTLVVVSVGYVVFFHSRKRHGHLPWQERMERLLSFKL